MCIRDSYRITQTDVRLAGGINIGLLGQIHAGWQQTWYKAQIDTGSPLFPAESKDYNGWFASLDLDQTDRLYFPTKGWSANTRYFDSQTEDYSKLDADLRGYTSLGNWVFATRLSYQGSPIGKLPVSYTHLDVYKRQFSLRSPRAAGASLQA